MNDVAVRTDQLPALSSADLINRVTRIREIQANVMKDHVDYGHVPGCGDKPTLLKPGAETLLLAFEMAALPDQLSIQDLGGDDEVRYRVVAPIYHTPTGRHCGNGLGECSSLEEKYKWRKAVCQAEWDETDPDRRRNKWGRDGSSTPQIRTNKADVANTVLKMAKKRALVDAALTVTAASRIFTQDLEDLPEEIRNNGSAPKPKTAAPKPEPSGPVFPNYGRAAGKPIADGTDDDLRMYAAGAERSLRDPQKARFLGSNERLLAAIQDEQARRQAGTAGDPLEALEATLIQTEPGRQALASIRDGFGLAEGERPLLPDQLSQYRDLMSASVTRHHG